MSKYLIRNLLREHLLLSEVYFKPENEVFSAYNGRYLFNVSAAYNYIEKKKVASEVKKFSPIYLNQFSHPEFSGVDSTKIDRLKNSLDLSKPLGLLVNFKNPETGQTEWILIDGNHRTRVAGEADQTGLLYVIKNPEDVKRFMKVNASKPHALFPDED